MKVHQNQQILFQTNRGILSITIGFFLFILTACTTSLDPDYHLDGSVDKIPIEVLNSAPESLEIDGMNLEFKSDLWRDFMPISPPDGKPLIARIELRSKDGRGLPEQLDTDAIWVVHKHEVWGSAFSDEQFDHDPSRLVKVARDGPKFGPDVRVTVVIQVRYGDESYLLRKTGQEIIKTW
ncbi:MAG: hypothetical protein WD513_02645 [Balneolaceae bacterium]